MQLDRQQIKTFQEKILSWYGINKRDLPWRRTRNPYHILISEVMAQQTQLRRVIPKYLGWLERFPTIERLAAASSRDVLTMWSGLGYNRRALYLQEAAKEIVETFQEKFPKEIETLKKLPGIGEYTANAIACFAFDEQVAVVDTNVKKVILTQILKEPQATMSDKEIYYIARQLLPVGLAYEWNQALMDYATAQLKKEKVPIPKQSHFKTSDRYYRGQIVKLLIKHHQLQRQHVFNLLDKQKDFSYERFESIVNGLKKDRLLMQRDDNLIIL